MGILSYGIFTFLGTLSLASAGSDSVCAFVNEGTMASLSCPSGQIITGFQFATFGTFTSNSSCASSLLPLSDCPTTVIAQANRLCVGANACNLSCDCVSLPNPCGCNSNTPSLSASTVLRLAFPTVPCPNVPKQLGLIATCEPALPSPIPQPAPPLPSPTNLLLEFMPSPVLGLDNFQPHFSWTPPSVSGRVLPSAVQSAARITLSFYPNNSIVWDSGVINTTLPLYVPSAPLPLQSDTRYQWTVTTQANNVWSPPSLAARFNTGLFYATDWTNAGWIGGWKHGTLMRKDFTVTTTDPIAYVSVFVSACQYYLLYLDGERIGTHELDVVWTRFQYYRSYATYELDPALFTSGQHTLGLGLGQGFCGESLGKAGNHSTQGLLRLALYGTDGSLLQPPIVTDTTWFTSSGPVLTDSNYYGEQYNASMEQPGWAAPGFIPSPIAPAWTPAVYTMDPPIPPTMTSQLMPAIERVGTLAPVSITTVTSGNNPPSYTFDFGQEIAGRTLLTIPPNTVPAGTNFTIKHTEVLSHPPYATYDGTAWMGNLFWAYPVDSYITAGKPNGETYEPAFTEHGFRYAQLFTDAPLSSPPSPSMLTAVILRTNAREQTQLIIGNQILQGISNNSWWTEAAALMGIPAGAAARGERTGWTGDAAHASESELVDFDTGAFFTQFLQQIQQLQCSDGTVPSCIPNTDPERDGFPPPLPCTNAEGDPSWGTVYPTIAWGVWKYYGATGVARRHYPSLLTYMTMLETRVNSTGLGNIFCEWGDWNPVVRTSCHITAAATYLHDLMHMIEVATALGYTADAATFSARLISRRNEYHTAFWNTTLGLYGDGTQVAQAVALWTGVASIFNVATNVSTWLGQSMVNGGLTFGFIGVRYAFEALALNGQIEAALRTLLQTTYPSYGFELYNLYEPATSLWESWDAPTHTQWLDESSRDHHYQASINTFLRKHVVGLDMPNGASAWSSIVVRPYAALPLAADIAAAVPYARATVTAYAGAIEVSWIRLGTENGNGLQLNTTLPSGTSGSVSVPKTFGTNTVCRESGTIVWSNQAYVPGVNGILSGSDDGEFITFTVTSGAFIFTTATQ